SPRESPTLARRFPVRSRGRRLYELVPPLPVLEISIEPDHLLSAVSPTLAAWSRRRRTRSHTAVRHGRPGFVVPDPSGLEGRRLRRRARRDGRGGRGRRG